MGQARRLSAHKVGVVCALLGALGFAFKAIFVKAAYRYGVDTETLLALRMGYALPCFIVMGWWVSRRAPMRLTRRDWGLIALTGFIGYYLSSYLDFLGLRYISAALERLILFLYPTLVVLLSVVIYRRPLTRRSVGALLLGYCGILLAVWADVQGAGRAWWLGVLLVFLSALSYAVFLLVNESVVKRLGAPRMTALATSVACVLCLGQFAVLRPLSSLQQPVPVHLYGLAMAIFSTVLPIWLTAEAVRRLGAGGAAVIATLGPILTIGLAVLFLGEHLTVWQGVGAVLVIAGVKRMSYK